jgi:hypothetical protein
MADVAAFPAAQSILWQQAISMGLPLVVGDLAKGEQDVSYLNIHENIWIADPAIPLPDAMYGMIRSLVGNKDLRERMARGAAQTTDELLDWNVLVHRALRFSPKAHEDPKRSGSHRSGPASGGDPAGRSSIL